MAFSLIYLISKHFCNLNNIVFDVCGPYYMLMVQIETFTG